MTELQRDARRIEVRHLADQGLSNRAVAAKVGVSKDTVRRWLAADRATTPTGAPDHEPPATPGADRLIVALDDDLRDHLAVLAEADHTTEQAVVAALEHLADAYRTAWDFGYYPRGVRPEVRARIVPQLPDRP